MKFTVCRTAFGALLVALALASGCSTTADKVHQFSPVPSAKIGSQELDPAQAKNATALLRAANDEWAKGNESQRLGDQKAALLHYSRMLQYMSDADLNPAVFSGLRDEFERILSTSPESADLFERDHPEFNRELADRASRSELFKGNVLAQQRVMSEIDDIKRRYPKNFQSGLDRSWHFRPYIEHELVAAGLPKELVWLAMVESLFQPTVVSRAGATGMWQFMPSTGRRYGLRIDNYVDERRDWEKATRAAISYLKDLHKFHNGAWPLAVASYNMGEGGISRMVAMNGGERDIWRLMDNPPASDHMPEETKKFYPKLVAYSIVATSPTTHGFKSNAVEREATARVPVNGSHGLAALERAGGLSAGTLKRLNPALVRGTTPPSGEYGVIVPAEAGAQITTALASLAHEPKRSVASLEGRTFYVVKKGDTLAGIAKKYDVDQKDIVDANKIRLATRLSIGKKLLIPTEVSVDDDAKPQSSPLTPEAVSTPSEKAPAPAQVPPKKYRVKKGDTLFKIALDSNVSLEAIQRENNLDKHARIHVNQELTIPGTGAVSGAEDTSRPTTSTHVVSKGETLAVIAQKYGVKVDDLVASNGLTSTTIRIGDKLLVARAADGTPLVEARPEPAAAPAKVPVKEAPAESFGVYTVVAGDTLSGVAAKHRMKLSALAGANGLENDATIKIGQQLKVTEGAVAPVLEPKTEVAVATPKAEPVTAVAGDKAVGVKMHTVEKGQTLSAIATKYGVKVSELVAWNTLGDKAPIHIGQKLIVSTPKVASSAVAATSNTDGTKNIHKVSEGQSPASIAKRYGVKMGDLFAWNSWEKDRILHIGDEVIVYTK